MNPAELDHLYDDVHESILAHLTANGILQSPADTHEDTLTVTADEHGWSAVAAALADSEEIHHQDWLHTLRALSAG